MNSARVSLPRDAPASRLPPLPAHDNEVPPRAGVDWPVAILGVPFDPVTTGEAIQRIDAMIATRLPHYVVTANVDFLVQAHRDVELRRILLEADLVLCDGTPVLWASRWLGNPLPERVAGSDLAPALLAAAAEKGHRVFLLGAADGVAALAAERIAQQYPKLKVVGHFAPPFSPLLEMNHEETVQRVQAARPDILLVSFGCPKQEKWIAMHYRALGVPVAIGVGATLDFLAGRIKRAPDWMRRTGTEWVYRLSLEPKRLYKRYADDLVCFLPSLARQWVHLDRGCKHSADQPEVSAREKGWSTITAGEQLTRRTLQQQAPFWSSVQRLPAHCLFDLAQVRAVDATGVAFLIRWRKSLLQGGHHLVLLAPSRALQRVMRSLKLTEHFLIVATATEAEKMASTLFTPRTFQREGETRSLSWCGEITAANVNEVRQMMEDHLQVFATSQTNVIIIDLAQLRFIDSSGAALMLRLKRAARALRVEVLFCRPQASIRNVLRLTRTDQLLLESGQ